MANTKMPDSEAIASKADKKKAAAILNECYKRQVVAPEWGTPQNRITEYDQILLEQKIAIALADNRTATWDAAIAAVGQVRLRLWREYTDSQIVMLNMVCNEIIPALESMRAT